MKTLFFSCLLCLVLITVSCRKRNTPVDTQNCDKEVTVLNDAFPATETNYTIMNAAISGNCLTLDIGASTGCGLGISDIELYANFSMATIYPPVVNLKVHLDNLGDCAAAPRKAFTFDLTPLKRGNTGTYTLGIEGWGKPIQYKY